MQVVSGHYDSVAGLRVWRREHIPAGPPRAAALFVHGLGDHGERHEEHLDLLADCGVLSAAIDLPGHGRSLGRRGHIDRLETVQTLIGEELQRLRGLLPAGTPLGLMGHSMGGFFVLHFLGSRLVPVDFAWVSSPLVNARARAGRLKIAAARLLGRVCPELTLRSGVRTEECKRDLERIEATRRDPLVHREISLRLGGILLHESSRLEGLAARIPESLKLLMTHGGEDRICPAAEARRLFDRIPARQKEFLLFPELLHEPFNDIGREEFYAGLAGWIGATLPVLGRGAEKMSPMAA